MIFTVIINQIRLKISLESYGDGYMYHDSEMTSKSKEELNKFVNRANKAMDIILHGDRIDGQYTEDNVSQDIDIVVYDEKCYYKNIVSDYFEKFGFRKRNLGTTDARYCKSIVLNE